MLKGGESGPAAVPGKPEESLLIRAVGYKGELKMPPTGKLAHADIARLKHWVALGAPWPDTAGTVVALAGRPFRISDAQRRWWAFQPVRAVTPPAVKDTAWPRSEIDRFILARLEARGIPPAPPADRRTLIRRVTFDLTGLPPTPEEVETFLKDRRPDAFARVVDRLLSSSAYGERWGRHWLDVARYADYYQANPHEHGSANKFELFEAYRYRDWVVEAFNRDLPYDRFVFLQIAGDLVPSAAGRSDAGWPGLSLRSPGGSPGASKTQPRPRGANDQEPERARAYDGQIATALLALGSWDHGDADKDKLVSDIVDDQIDTVGKAFLGLTLGCARCHDHKFDPISQRDYYGLAGIFYSTHILGNVGAKGDHSVIGRWPLASPEYLRKRGEQTQRLERIDGQIAALSAGLPEALLAPQPALARLVVAERAARVGTLRRQRDEFAKTVLPAPPQTLGAQEGGTPGGLFPGIQDVPIHIRGSYTRLGPKVPRRLPVLLAGDQQAPITHGSGRLELAKLVASKDNPLTARVIVNRIWQEHFGDGIVRTPSNFGRLGDLPTHPELLDWLADRFIRDGWSMKVLHRRIVLSAVYQQASTVGQDVLRKDPDNRWLGRMNARRLEAEAIRDAMLSVTSRLDPARGGPAALDVDLPRRSLYVQTTRWDRNNFSTLFDAANPDQTVEKRTVSTVAPQALFLLNHTFVQAEAGRLARRLTTEVTADETARIARAYHLLLARPPRAEEVEIGKAFLHRDAARHGSEAAWTDYAHILLCSNEFVYVD
jgi:hypothetical protein